MVADLGSLGDQGRGSNACEGPPRTPGVLGCPGGLRREEAPAARPSKHEGADDRDQSQAVPRFSRRAVARSRGAHTRGGGGGKGTPIYAAASRRSRRVRGAAFAGELWPGPSESDDLRADKHGAPCRAVPHSWTRASGCRSVPPQRPAQAGRTLGRGSGRVDVTVRYVQGGAAVPTPTL